METRSVTVLSRILCGEVPRLVHVEVSFTPATTMSCEVDTLSPEEADFYARTARGAFLSCRYGLRVGHIKVAFRGAVPRPYHCFSLAVVTGLAVITEQIDPKCLEHYEFTGFVNIAGELQHGRGALLAIRAASQDGRCSVVAERDWRRLSLIENAPMLVVRHIKELIEHLRGSIPRALNMIKAPSLPIIPPEKCAILNAHTGGFEEIALTTACAGALTFKVQVPDDKTALDTAYSVANLLPNLDANTALEVAMRRDLAGWRDTEESWGRRIVVQLDCGEYLREPRRTAQDIGCVEAAHQGVLFVHAAPYTAEARGWLEAYTDLSEQRRNGTVPTQFQLVMAEPDCKCADQCKCIPHLSAEECKALHRIRQRLSDIQIKYDPAFIPPIRTGLEFEQHVEQLRSRIAAAREIQLSRAGKLNAQLTDQEAEDLCALTLPDEQIPPAARNRLREAQASPKIKRIARTLADLDASDEIEESHKTMAANLFLGFCLFSPQT